MKFLVVLLSLGTLVGSYTAFKREYAVAYLARSPAASVFAQLSAQNAAIDLPLSARGMREAFTVCGDVQQGLFYALQTQQIKQRIDDTCAKTARRALGDVPTFSAAYTIAMLSSSEPGEIAEMAVLSQLTAPSESWNAKLRLRHAGELFGTARADLDDALLADVAFLVQSRDGRKWLAGLYRREPGLQPLLIRAIDQRPAEEKKLFLNEVRRLG